MAEIIKSGENFYYCSECKCASNKPTSIPHAATCSLPDLLTQGKPTEKAPDDTIAVIETLVKEVRKVLPEIDLMHRLLITGALIDAESLIEELRGKKPLANPASMK
jgi:hypothetical protein